MYFKTILISFSKEIKIGSDWRDEINIALKDSDFALFLISQKTARSPWVMFEFGKMHVTTKNGHLFPLLIDIDPSEFSKICPPLSYLHAVSLFESESIYGLVAQLCDALSNSAAEKLAIKSRAKREYSSLRMLIDNEIKTNEILPDKFSGLIAFNSNIEQSNNFRMPQIFSRCQKIFFSRYKFRIFVKY